VIGAVLGPGQPAALLWAWGNWCDKSVSRFRAWARIGQRVIPGRERSSAPYCVGPGTASSLTPSYGYG
jgi:hypothetical protein